MLLKVTDKLQGWGYASEPQEVSKSQGENAKHCVNGDMTELD